MNTTLIGALCKKRVGLASLLNAKAQLPKHGHCGRPSVPAWESMPSDPNMKTRFLSSNCLPNATEPAPSLPDVDWSGLARWKMPYERWARRTPGWGPRTLV